MKKISFLFLCISLLMFRNSSAQQIEAFPPHWYKGMEDTVLQLIIHHKDIRDAKLNMISDAVKITKRYPSNHVDYMMIDLSIPKDFLGSFIPFEFIIKKKKVLLSYELKNKPALKKPILNQSDLIYLIMPDRFANADESNDVVSSMEEKKVNRNEPFGRH